MKRLPFVLLILIALTAAGFGGPFSRSMPNQPGVVQRPAGWFTETLRVGILNRDYDIFIPSSLMDDPPVVFVLHGGGGDKRKILGLTAFGRKAQEEGFIVVFPNAWLRPVLNTRHWNSGGPDAVEAWHGVNDIPDVSFLEAALTQVRARHPIGTKAFVTGPSRGGMMVYNMACSSTAFDGYAPVIASLLVDSCSPPETGSLSHLAGEDDTTVVWGGGGVQPYPAVQDGLDTLDAAGWTTTAASISNCGHEWPTISACNFDATADIWTFFDGLL